MSDLGDRASHAVHAVGEAVSEIPVAIEQQIDKHPRVRRAWFAARPILKFSLYGAAFAGGAILLARLLGPRTVRQLGRDGGEGFAEGVNKAQTQLAAATRGMRWG